ncbi:MAG: hypothetical protein BME94_07920 [Methanobacteriales archaeon Met13]
MKYHLNLSKEDPKYDLLEKIFKIIGSRKLSVLSWLNRFSNSRNMAINTIFNIKNRSTNRFYALFRHFLKIRDFQVCKSTILHFLSRSPIIAEANAGRNAQHFLCPKNHRFLRAQKNSQRNIRENQKF